MYSVDNLLNSVDIPYTESGSDYLVRCLSPDHDDSSPSMRIDKITGVFGCFSCGFSGNIFKHFEAPKDENAILRHTLHMRIQKTLGELVGHEIPPKSLPFREEYRGIPGRIYEEFEAFTHNQNSDYQDRLWFPLHDATGKIACFIGRDTLGNQKNKYKIYPKHSKVPLVPAIPKPVSGRIVIVEGIFDLLNLYKNGWNNVVAILGVNKVTNDHLDIWKYIGVEHIDVIFDGDDAGINESKKLVEKCSLHGISAESIELPPGLDPGDMTSAQVQELKELLYE